MKHSLVYEINTAVYLGRLSEKMGRRVTLDEIPEAEFAKLKDLGVTTIWFMGVWERSPSARTITASDQGLMAEFEHVLPDFGRNDLMGSAYAIKSYTVEAAFGGDEALKKLYAKLKQLQLDLLLDFVPNHTSPDSDLVHDHRKYHITGTAIDLETSPENYIELNDTVYARGRDPMLPAWGDVVQLNAFLPSYRETSVDTLLRISEFCDGVRCDMAMLMMNDIFANTWGEAAGPVPETEYWQEIIDSVKQKRPDFTFVAEAYWDTEHALISQGFDYCYDKTLYDHLHQGVSEAVSEHIRRTAEYRNHLLTFIENHDEVRAATIYTPDRALAASAILYTLPGAALIHDGQLEGHKARIPVHLGRAPKEQTDDTFYQAYASVLTAAKAVHADANDWSLVDTSNPHVLAWQISGRSQTTTVVVNYSAVNADATVPLSDSYGTQGNPDALTLSFHNQTPPYSLSDDGRQLDASLGPWQVLLLTAKHA